MTTRREANTGILAILAAGSMPCLAAADAPVIALPPPHKTGGKPLMEALAARQSTRAYANRTLPAQVLSDLLWAAWGVNRPQNGFRTAPSSHSFMDIDIYLAMANGVWIYDPKAHRISRYLQEDLRAQTTTDQDYVKTAALNLIYVSEAARMQHPSAQDRLLNGIADSAVIAQNVYLFCASAGLGTVLRASVPGKELASRLRLKPTQAIYFAQSVGYPKV